jgi:hypothetical protein
MPYYRTILLYSSTKTRPSVAKAESVAAIKAFVENSRSSRPVACEVWNIKTPKDSSRETLLLEESIMAPKEGHLRRKVKKLE